MNDLPIAAHKRRAVVPPVWIIPVLCLLMAVGYAVNHYRGRGPEITIRFPDGADLMPQKTAIRYLGVDVGLVTGVRIDREKEDVVATARLAGGVADLAREGTVFVAIKPRVSFQGVEGLTTIFSGAYLEMRPGDGEPAEEFKGYASAADVAPEGLTVILVAPKVGSLEAGDAIYYRGVRVGSIAGTELSPTGQDVLLTAKIDYKYDQFVRDNTVFWEASGLRAKVGLLGAKISVDSFDTLMRGGVAFATPTNPGAKVKSGARFDLKPRVEPVYETWNPRL